jgi:hypothetical protein
MFYLLLTFLVTTITTTHIIQSLYLHYDRKRYYESALQRSKSIEKPLLVVGDPAKGISCKLFGIVYGLGDTCIDLRPITQGVIKTDLLQYLKTLPDNSRVIYISCVLEYIPGGLTEIIQEIYRVANTHENIFIVHVSPHYYTMRYLYCYQGDIQYNLILKAPPTTSLIQWCRN